MPSISRFRTRFVQDNWEIAAQKNFLVPQHKLVAAQQILNLALARVSLAPIRLRPRKYPLLREFTFFEQDRRVCGSPLSRHEPDAQRLLDRAAFYNHLRAACPQVRLYVFPSLHAEDWYVAGGAYGGRAGTVFVGDRYVRDFRALLDPSIGYAWAGEGNSVTEAMSRYYRTDHHWNFKGAYQVYSQVWELFHAQNPSISKLRQARHWTELPDLKFYGSYARRAGYFDQISDAIVDAQFAMPELEVHIHGFEDQRRNSRAQYAAGNYAPGQFANHYGAYYGHNYGLVKYACPAETGSLLVVGDSFDNCIEPLLASHFRYTYFVDLRHYAKELEREFVVEEFVRENKITDVLFIGMQSWVLGFEPWRDGG